jgi:hypothetical protein
MQVTKALLAGTIVFALAGHAVAAPLTADAKTEALREVDRGTLRAAMAKGAPTPNPFAQQVTERCDKAAAIAAAADPDVYVRAEISRCRGEAAATAGDAKACDYWKAALLGYLDPKVVADSADRLQMRLGWVKQALARSCGVTD